ncbi:MAG: DMT family transporter, partial [Planctomycetes bacterium]|nr:DMT family transporter [Planctomycetota bacterium]
MASFNNIINVDTVVQGWKIVRDLCNMFFILILLVIAFATILRIESYNMKRWLPKLLIMAVLINFSRMICGLIVDFAQVIMLTFVNGLGANAENNLVNVFQLKEYYKFTPNIENEVKQVGALQTVATILAGLIAMGITMVVVAVLLGILLIRVILLWVYTILSPLAFLLSSFPAGQRYSSQWWSEFSKQVVVGPMLAFFIWLAITTVSNSANSLTQFNFDANSIAAGGNKVLCAGTGSLFCSDKFTLYIITIALLMGGLIVTQQVGGMAGSIAGKGMAAIQKGKNFGINTIKGAGISTAKFGARTGLAVASGATVGAGWALEKTKVGGMVGKPVKEIGKIGWGWAGDMRKNRADEKSAKRRKFLEKMGMGEKASDQVKQFLGKDETKIRANSLAGAMAGTAAGAGFGPVGMAAGGIAGAAAGGLITYGAQGLKKWGSKSERSGKWYGKAAKAIGGSIQDFMINPTESATGKMSQNYTNARNRRADAASRNDYISKESSSSNIYGNKANDEYTRLLEMCNNDDPESKKVAEGFIADINNSRTNPSKKVNDNLVAFAKALAVLEKRDGLGSNLMSVKTALQANGGQNQKQISIDPETYKEKVIYRQTGKRGNVGSGKASIAGTGEFAEGKSNAVDVPFARMENVRAVAGKDFDISAEGAHLKSPQLVQAAKQDMEKYYNEEIARMQKQTDRDMGEGKEFKSSDMRDRTVASLEKAKARLKDPDFQPDSLELTNSSGYNYDAKERKVTAIHESMHEKGVENDPLTERLTQKIADTKQYNAKDDIATEAAKYEKEAAAKGITIDESNVDQHAAEITKRVVENYEKMLGDMAKVSVESGGKVKRTDLSEEM